MKVTAMKNNQVTTLNYFDNLGIAYHQIVNVEFNATSDAVVTIQTGNTPEPRKLTNPNEAQQFKETLAAYNDFSLALVLKQAGEIGSSSPIFQEPLKVLEKNKFVCTEPV